MCSLTACLFLSVSDGCVCLFLFFFFVFFLQAEDGIRDLVRSRGLGDVYKRQVLERSISYTSGLYALRLLNSFGVPTVNTAAVAEVCGDKLTTSAMLAKAGVPQPRNVVAFTCLLYTSPSPPDPTRALMPYTA